MFEVEGVGSGWTDQKGVGSGLTELEGATIIGDLLELYNDFTS